MVSGLREVISILVATVHGSSAVGTPNVASDSTLLTLVLMYPAMYPVTHGSAMESLTNPVSACAAVIGTSQVPSPMVPPSGCGMGGSASSSLHDTRPMPANRAIVYMILLIFIVLYVYGLFLRSGCPR